jgi:hypothetical protein
MHVEAVTKVIIDYTDNEGPLMEHFLSRILLLSFWGGNPAGRVLASCLCACHGGVQ